MTRRVAGFWYEAMPPAGPGLVVVVMPHHALLQLGPGDLEIALHVFGILIGQVRPIVRLGLVLQEGGEPLVDPGVTLLVGPHDHGHPHVAQLVGRDGVEVESPPSLVAPHEGEHGELHSSPDDVRRPLRRSYEARGRRTR